MVFGFEVLFNLIARLMGPMPDYQGGFPTMDAHALVKFSEGRLQV